MTQPCKTPVLLLRNLHRVGVDTTPRTLKTARIFRGRDGSAFVRWDGNRATLRADERFGRCRLLATHAGKVQTLVDEKSYRGRCGISFQLRWVGDLDDDTYPDLVVRYAISDGRCWTNVLALSSHAGRADVAGVVAEQSMCGC